MDTYFNFLYNPFWWVISLIILFVGFNISMIIQYFIHINFIFTKLHLYIFNIIFTMCLAAVTNTAITDHIPINLYRSERDISTVNLPIMIDYKLIKVTYGKDDYINDGGYYIQVVLKNSTGKNIKNIIMTCAASFDHSNTQEFYIENMVKSDKPYNGLNFKNNSVSKYRTSLYSAFDIYNYCYITKVEFYR